jgi:starch-binding outer membrane protein, SusD/RagB family
VKFGAYENEILNPVNASDWPRMRVEEMILIEAEAKAMAGDLQGGKEVLRKFVTTYRDPSYQLSSAGSAEEFQDEVWFQRRVELWGEGFSFFDVLRLKKPIIRAKMEGTKVNSSYGSTSTINLPAEAPILLFLIPEGEIEASESLSPADNNETIPAPKPLG